MRAPFAWWWPVLAAALTVVAVLMSADYAVAVPAAVGAVLVAAVAVGEAVTRLAAPPTASALTFRTPTSTVRDLFQASELGREDLLLMLDRLERKSSHPNLPARTPQEIEAIVTLRPDEFRRYVAGRIASLEGTT